MENIWIYECPECHMKLTKEHFYTDKKGNMDIICKRHRLAKGLDNRPWTFFDAMKYFDIPYIEWEWIHLMGFHIAKAINLNTSNNYAPIFGQYLAKMKLMSFKNLKWEDSKKFKDWQPVSEDTKALLINYPWSPKETLTEKEKNDFIEYLNLTNNNRMTLKDLEEI